MKAVLVVGNVVDGVTFIGPFDSADEAHEYADTTREDEWLCCSLEDPETK